MAFFIHFSFIFDFIFVFIFIALYSKMKLRIKKEIDSFLKNGTLTSLLQKVIHFSIIFHHFGTVPGEKNAFSHHFSKFSFSECSQFEVLVLAKYERRLESSLCVNVWCDCVTTSFVFHAYVLPYIVLVSPSSHF